MRQFLTQLFWFILKYFEGGEQEYSYKPMNRKILLVVGLLFTALSMATLFFSSSANGYGFLIPVIVFLAVGTVCIVVASLGSDRAVARIWGNR